MSEGGIGYEADEYEKGGAAAVRCHFIEERRDILYLALGGGEAS
jgi:hypothetical protein